MATPLKSSLPQGPESAIDNDQTGPKPRLLDQVRDVIRCKHYSIRTESTYTEWIERIFLAQDRFVPILEQVAMASMTAVEASGMAGQQSPHHAGDGGITRP